jgi:hypothetical protein
MCPELSIVLPEHRAGSPHSIQKEKFIRKPNGNPDFYIERMGSAWGYSLKYGRVGCIKAG